MTEQKPIKKIFQLETVSELRNYLNRAIASLPEQTDILKDDVMKSVVDNFLSECVCSGNKPLTPELFLFFLQNLNAQRLFLSMDSKNYTLIYPTYVPFDVWEYAKQFGYPNLKKTIEDNYTARRIKLAGKDSTKTAALHFRDNRDCLDKVASASDTHMESGRYAEITSEIKGMDEAEHNEKMAAARSMHLRYSGLADAVKPLYPDPRSKDVLSKITEWPVKGRQDKTAGVTEIKKFCELVDWLVENK